METKDALLHAINEQYVEAVEVRSSSSFCSTMGWAFTIVDTIVNIIANTIVHTIVIVKIIIIKGFAGPWGRDSHGRGALGEFLSVTILIITSVIIILPICSSFVPWDEYFSITIFENLGWMGEEEGALHLVLIFHFHIILAEKKSPFQKEIFFVHQRNLLNFFSFFQRNILHKKKYSFYQRNLLHKKDIFYYKKSHSWRINILLKKEIPFVERNILFIERKLLFIKEISYCLLS